MVLANFKARPHGRQILLPFRAVYQKHQTCLPAALAAVVGSFDVELGARAESLHRQVGGWAAAAEIDKLMITGEFADAVASGAADAGMNRDDIFTGSRDEILDALKASLHPGDWVLIKGSRGARMDTIVEGLKEWAGVKEDPPSLS